MEKRTKIRLLITIIAVILSLTLLGVLIYIRIITNTSYSMSVLGISTEEVENEIPELIITDDEKLAMEKLLSLPEVTETFDEITDGEIQAAQLDVSLAQTVFDEYIPHIEVKEFNVSSQVIVISGTHSNYDYIFTVSGENAINKSVSEHIYEENQSSTVYMNTDNNFFTKSEPTLDIIDSIF